MKKTLLSENLLLSQLQEILKGEYKFEGIIGQGGTSYVVKVYNLTLKRLEALKIIYSKNVPNKNVIQRFYQETQSLSRLKKENYKLQIPEIYNFKQRDQFLFYTMEFIDGTGLDKVISQRSLDIKKSLQIVYQLAKNLNIMHNQGIIHRDIKPANIILDYDIEPWIVDFGLLKKIDSSLKITERGALLGTPTYMSPEQAMGKSVSKSTDVYSLGTVLYEMVTYEKYIKEKSLTGIFHSIVYDEHTVPSDEQEEVPPEVDDICTKALNKNPKKRYSSALDMSQDIKKCINIFS
ncbi:serine/threonine-protein kinase [Candidatus Uabimicrobium sp. HlEnr_7]|uniref:serine/threonine-protein kinase n=1 Tax=Candidatus Uabimicrobium helgolandensis TaxID=3095367 RepID=UPI00355875E6